MQPIVNRQVLREYEVLSKYQAGIKLTGPEVKSIKSGRLNLKGSYIRFVGNELYLVNADIPLYKYAQVDSYDPTRSRKLLLNKAELAKLRGKIKERAGLTIIPLKCYNLGNLIKFEIALSKGRKAHQIKSVEKERDIKRKDKQMVKEYLRK
jgi:SsrA-binding protein